MARETSVVTPERFSQGLDYPSYMDQIKVNKARFEGYYDGCKLSTEDAAYFKELAQRARLQKLRKHGRAELRHCKIRAAQTDAPI